MCTEAINKWTTASVLAAFILLIACPTSHASVTNQPLKDTDLTPAAAVIAALGQIEPVSGTLHLRQPSGSQVYDFEVLAADHVVISRPGTRIEVVGNRFLVSGRQTHIETDRDSIEGYLGVLPEWLTPSGLWSWFNQAYSSYAGNFVDDRVYFTSSMTRQGDYPLYLEFDIMRGVPVYLSTSLQASGTVSLSWRLGKMKH